LGSSYGLWIVFATVVILHTRGPDLTHGVGCGDRDGGGTVSTAELAEFVWGIADLKPASPTRIRTPRSQVPRSPRRRRRLKLKPGATFDLEPQSANEDYDPSHSRECQWCVSNLCVATIHDVFRASVSRSHNFLFILMCECPWQVHLAYWEGQLEWAPARSQQQRH
jgi:hypothetical protein